MADRKKILVIDDDSDITDVVKVILTANGFEVYTANNGKDGIAAASKINPDLVLCDMMMEQVDAGSRVAGEIRKNNKTVQLYLLSSIGEATAQNIEMDKIGFNGVFQKPIMPDHIVKTIKKALGISY